MKRLSACGPNRFAEKTWALSCLFHDKVSSSKVYMKQNDTKHSFRIEDDYYIHLLKSCTTRGNVISLFEDFSDKQEYAFVKKHFSRELQFVILIVNMFE